MLFKKTAQRDQFPKHIFITGASSGIGHALALAYAAPGIRLVLCGRSLERLEQTALKCQEKGADVHVCPFDVTDAKQAREAIETTVQMCPLDLVIANAGISCGSFGEAESDQATRAIFETNIIGVLNTALPALDAFKKQGYGQLAVMSSVAGFLPLPSCPAYAASKACVRFWSEALRPVYAPQIKINVICPGFVKTPLTDANSFPMPLMIQPEKAAQLIMAGLRANRKRIVFPASYRYVVKAALLLPETLRAPILNKLPKKEA